ncbi:Rap1a/Tai family immunity protein [Mesorhizobium sp. M0808]|uniref:Rap1a/Tai family immunity protein n=1 Tax=Mesorhizobium sp. M0808 TaxID=2957002 RepID=UPI00333AFEFD
MNRSSRTWLAGFALASSILPSHAEFFQHHPCDDMRSILDKSICATSYPPLPDNRAGNDAFEYCSGPNAWRLSAYLSGYLLKFESTKPSNICLPLNPYPDQLRDVFCQYMSEHPAERHQRWDNLFEQSMRGAFACTR